MIRINLLPAEERLPKWRTRRIFIMLSLAVVFLFSLIYGFNEALLYYTGPQLQEVRNRYEALGPAREKMRQAGLKQGAINQKQALLANLAKDKAPSYPILAKLGAKMPPEVWLTDLEIDKGLLKISGMAKNYPDMVALMQNLEQEELLAEPALGKAEQDAVLAASKFEMTAKIRGK
jgi:Tfp pilus assembly protein PilN